MATPFIGPYSFLGWEGTILESDRRFAVVRRPNYDGLGIVFDAWEAPPATITTTSRYGSSEPLPDFRVLVGQDVDVVDPLGQRWSCTVASVRQGPPSVMVDGSTVRQVVWTLIPTTDVPDQSTVGVAG